MQSEPEIHNSFSALQLGHIRDPAPLVKMEAIAMAIPSLNICLCLVVICVSTSSPLGVSLRTIGATELLIMEGYVAYHQAHPPLLTPHLPVMSPGWHYTNERQARLLEPAERDAT